MSLDVNARLDRLERAVSNGLNIDLSEFDTPEDRAADAEAAAQAAADEVAAQQAAAEQAAADKKAADEAAAAPEAPVIEQPVDEASVVDDSAAHNDAVVATQDAISAVVPDGSGNPPSAPPDQHAAIIAKANADINAALAQWPDSPELQDLKAQLDELAA